MLDILSTLWYYSALALGLFTLVVWTYRTLCMLLRNCGFGTKCTTARYGKDSWAVVTGGTDGIGKAAAIHLAREGFNIVLMSRTKAKLDAVAAELVAEGKQKGQDIKTKVIQIDFTKTFDADTFSKIYKDELKSLDISILVNNVGMSGGKMVPFLKQTE